MRCLSVNLGLTALVLAAASRARGATATDGSLAVPNQLIVEYVKGAAIPRDLDSASVKVLKTYDSDVFSGSLIELAPSQGVATLASAPHIAAIWPNRPLSLVQPVASQIVAPNDTTSYNPHRVTGVSQLHEAGILGAGAKVGIIDTGVWYLHPALGGCFGPGCKVAGGYDFVGDADLSAVPQHKQPDADPISLPDVGHGTHVSGIVAGVSDKFVGVAPNATLFAYKVTGIDEGTDTATLVEAFLRAYEDGVDIINCSIGGPDGWADNPLAVVISRIVRAGIIVAVAAGNGGEDGAFVGDLGAAAPEALAVASVQGESAPATPFQVNYLAGSGANATARTQIVGCVGDDVFPSNITDWPLVALSYNTSNAADACDTTTFPAGLNLTGKVALVRRGGCNFSVKQANLATVGGLFVLVYSDDRPVADPGNTLPSSTIGMITASAGAELIAALQTNQTLTVDFSYSGPEAGVADPLGNTPNFFTSWAANYDLWLKPDVAAPGGNILSTWSGEGEQYAVQSGTSMASPYIAGLAALYVGMTGGRTMARNASDFALGFQRRVVASGTSLPWTNRTAVVTPGFVAPPVQMGSGLLDAVQTLWGNTTVDQSRMNLNDTVDFQGRHELTLTNNGPETIAYNFSLEAAAGFEILDPDLPTWKVEGIKTFDEMVPMDLIPDVQLPDAVQIGPGESKSITVVFANPADKGWNASLIPLYSGKVIVEGSNGDRLAVPYMGLATDLRTKRVFQSGYPSSFSGVNFTSIDEKATYTFDTSPNAHDYPRLDFALDWGVQELRWDIFTANWSESDWSYPPSSATTPGFIGAVARWPGYSDLDANLTDPAVAGVSEVTPVRDLARNGFYSRVEVHYFWLGLMGDGKRIEAGNYTMRVAASRPFADLATVEGWDVWRRKIQVL